jgi:hypothetical protein
MGDYTELGLGVTGIKIDNPSIEPKPITQGTKNQYLLKKWRF